MAKKGLDSIHELPYKESMTKGKDYCCKHYHNDMHKVDGKYPWTHVGRILKKYKGKNVNKAFTHYCSIVPDYQQYHFWDEISKHENLTRFGYRYNRTYRWGYWYLDKLNRIQYKKPIEKESGYEIWSHDLKWGSKPIRVVDESKRWWKNGYSYMSEEQVVVQGEIFKFKRKDAAYHKCYAEQIDKKNKAERDARLEYERKLEEDEIIWRRKCVEDERIRVWNDKRENERIRDSHGFDEDSFTNNNGRLDDY